jgi:ABC-type amino acid transport substrate-binding protein
MLAVASVAFAAPLGGEQGGTAADSRPKALTVCAIPASMPRSDKAPDGTPQGLDAAIAQRVGRLLDRTIAFHWCASADCAWHCLPAGRCDVVLGQPYDSGPPRDVAWSVPYAGAQFGLVIPRDTQDVRSLADLLGKRVAIVAGTVAISERDHKVARFKSREALLSGFHAAGLDAALMDADFAAWYLSEHPRLRLRLVAEYVPREHWNVAMAVRAKDTSLLLEINRALAQLAESGELRKIYADLGVAFRPPFLGPARQQAAPDTWRRIRERGELVVSMDPANLPYSSARVHLPGFDVDLAYALAERLGVKLRIEWLDIRHETPIGQLLERECDLVFGEAVAANVVAGDQELAGMVLYSQPYYGTGFLHVARRAGPRAGSLSELKRAGARRVGTEAGSVADYALAQRGYPRRLYRNQLATLKALNDGDIDYAYLWANVGWTLHVSPELKLELAPNFVPEDRWNIAVAMLPGDDELKRHVDAALETLKRNGTVARVLGRYHVPSYAPFPESARGSAGSAHEPIRHGVADRGREPEMQTIQRSKHGYTGLGRIRASGELVVGLDPNNLPFSTAHPEPSGLDYEIAGLLAGELGVRLRVYWAYSSHDSYPSKLSARGPCDVLLGIMPDDRFEQSVVYSRPYYHARYQWVVRKGGALAAHADPPAIEQGVAVRGLARHALRPFPSTEAILEAVAQGRVTTGYVISTRGAWLAENRWRGKLDFLPTAETADCFPICAAVRKTDRHLKDAIDQAWDKLEQSGRLERVFARWHIPYEPLAAAKSTKERGS